MERIDARGLSCPQPVVLTQKAAQSGKKAFEIVVDSEVCLENVTRFVRNKLQTTPEIRQEGDLIIIAVNLG